MEPTDLTIEILKSIRDEIRTLREDTNKRFEGLSDEVRTLRRDTNDRFERLEGSFDALAQRQTEAELRLASELTAVVGAINEVKDLLERNLSTTLKDHERRITALETHTGA